MKHNNSKSIYFNKLKVALIFTTLAFGTGCALFNKTSELTLIGCSEEFNEKLKPLVTTMHQKIIQCLQSYKREADAAEFKALISEKTLSLTCESNSKGQPVSAEYPGAKNFPGLKFNISKIVKIDKNNKLESSLFHESIHLLGYKHYQDVDLSYIAETCCLDHGDNYLNKVAKQSCDLFKYQKSDWQKPQYITELTRALAPFGRGFVGVHTSINAASQLARHKSDNDIYPVLYAPLEEIISGVLNRKLKKTNIAGVDLNSIIYALVMNRIVSKSSDEKLLRKSVALSRNLAKRFYSNESDLEKLNYFLNVAEVIQAVIVKNPQMLTENWAKLKIRSEYICRDLKKFELDSIEDLLGYVGADLFELKNQIQVGDFFEIATYWDHPCDLFKSENKSNE